MIPIDILGVQLAGEANTPVVLLRELDEPHRIVPVAVGGSEALAIAMGLQGVSAPRPLTHDLLVDVLQQTSTTVEQVTITELRDGAFVAELALGGAGGDRVVDSRPSDALAIAVRLHVPLFMAAEVLEEAGLLPALLEVAVAGEPMSAEEAGELIENFRTFLDDIDPTDFED